MCQFENGFEVRLGWLDWSGGTDDETDETNIMKNMGLAHSDYSGGSKMSWRGKLYRINW